jgi:hypothetical protein
MEMKGRPVGLNVWSRVEGDKLILEVDLTQRHGDSTSGKTVRIASTLGNLPVEGREQIKFGLNVYETKAGRSGRGSSRGTGDMGL